MVLLHPHGGSSSTASNLLPPVDKSSFSSLLRLARSVGVHYPMGNRMHAILHVSDFVSLFGEVQGGTTIRIYNFCRTCPLEALPNEHADYDLSFTIISVLSSLTDVRLCQSVYGLG